MLPLGIIYFTVAVTGLAVSADLHRHAACALGTAPGLGALRTSLTMSPCLTGGSAWSMDASGVRLGAAACVAGLIILTLLMHLARALVRGHARLAKSLLVVPGA